MGHLADIVAGIATHPIGIVGLLTTAGVWVVLGRRILRLGAIIHELRGLPVQQRRYNLEREYRIYPGTGNPPIAFVRQRRRRIVTYLLVWTVVFAAILAGVTIRAARKADSVAWTLNDSQLVREGLGYNWQIELVNESPERVFIEKMDLKILAKQPHPDTARKRPEYPARISTPRKLVALKPHGDLVSIVTPAEQAFVAPRDKLILTVFLDAYHPVHEGWVYDVQLAVQWQVPDEITLLTKLGSVYRIGWPGMPHWSEPGSSAGPGTDPVTDPVVKLGE